METLINRCKISETFENVRQFSFEEKTASSFDEVKINKLLDHILELKTLFTNKTNKIDKLVEQIEEITWLNDPDNDSLLIINDLISSVRDLHGSLLSQFNGLNFVLSKGIAQNEINEFKTSVDDLKNLATDLESRFFFLPNIPDFKETTNELSLI